MSSTPQVFYLPIEALEDRYTKHMRIVVEDALGALKQAGYISQYFVVLGDVEIPQQVHNGQFLDSFGSNAYKAGQLAYVASLFASKKVRDHDVFLVGDYWFPGIEAIRMMAELAGIKVYLAGWNHAGCADPKDYYARTLGAWSVQYEAMLLGLFDFLAVGSTHHKQQVMAFADRHAVNVAGKLEVTGMPWRTHAVLNTVGTVNDRATSQRENRVVYSHRFAVEKAPYEFFEDAQWAQSLAEFDDWEFVISTNRKLPQSVLDVLPACVRCVEHATKVEYYRFLLHSKVFWSAAVQETFGYSLREAAVFGCTLVIPSCASYNEFVPAGGATGVHCFDVHDVAARRVALFQALYDSQVPPIELVTTQEHCLGRWLRNIVCQARFG